MAKFVSIGLFCAVADMSKPVDVAAIESQLQPDRPSRRGRRGDGGDDPGVEALEARLKGAEA